MKQAASELVATSPQLFITGVFLTEPEGRTKENGDKDGVAASVIFFLSRAGAWCLYIESVVERRLRASRRRSRWGGCVGRDVSAQARRDRHESGTPHAEMLVIPHVLKSPVGIGVRLVVRHDLSVKILEQRTVALA